MKIATIICALSITLFAACSQNSDTDSSMQEIEQELNKQQTAWNNGDITGFMAGYWESDSLLFIGKRGLTKGWDTTLSNYKRSYPTPEAMGQLTFDIQHKEMLGQTAAVTVGSWTLHRTQDTLGGYFSLTWAKKENNWKIVIDHTN